MPYFLRGECIIRTFGVRKGHEDPIRNRSKPHMDENKKELDLELSAEVAQGKYANLAIISHSPTEFVIDFAAMMPGVPKAKVHSRIIMTPEHAKRLLMSIQDNITRYETNIGRINFQTPMSEGQDDDQSMFGFNMGEA